MISGPSNSRSDARRDQHPREPNLGDRMNRVDLGATAGLTVETYERLLEEAGVELPAFDRQRDRQYDNALGQGRN